MISVIILTKNEENNIIDCLEHLKNQKEKNFEIIIVDDFSKDTTCRKVHKFMEQNKQVKLRLMKGRKVRPIFGANRNIGVNKAKGSIIAFISADAYPKKDWLLQINKSLKGKDFIFGKQIHKPDIVTVASIIRTTRYFIYGMAKKEITFQNLFFASNTNSAFRRKILQENRFNEHLTGGEDRELTWKLLKEGFKGSYNPKMVVFHKDSFSLKGEIKKNIREGFAEGQTYKQVSINWLLILWLLTTLINFILIFLISIYFLTSFILIAYFPLLRRLTKLEKKYQILNYKIKTSIAFIIVPFIDWLYGASYIWGVINHE